MGIQMKHKMSTEIKASRNIAPLEDILSDARRGRPFIIIDDSAEENTGHLVVAAQFATPSNVNFMARFARGLICLAIPQDAAGRLGLQPMPRSDTSARELFTVSIEAREGVTTGISAFDRARTVAVAVDPGSTAHDIVSPGHVFPMIVREGGVLVSSGHGEAGVDIARIAGLTPAAMICELLDGHGEMSRLPALLEFASEHGLLVGTVADLISYRRRSENLVERVATAPFSSSYGGDVTLHVYRDAIDGGEHIAMVRGDLRGVEPTLVRVHQVDLTTDLLGWTAARKDYVPNALRAIAEHDGPAVAIFLHDPSPTSIADRINGGRQDYMTANATRDYGLGAQILLDLGVRDMILLTSSSQKLAAIEGFGLRILERREILPIHKET